MDNTSSFNDIIMGKPRTAGDGMESNEKILEGKAATDKAIIKNKEHSILGTRLIQVYPKNISIIERRSSQIYSKNPKFVPYEPYPAAVKPLTPHLHKKNTKKSKNHMDINTLVSQMSQMKTSLNEYKPRTKLLSSNSTSDEKGSQNNEMQEKIDSLIKENACLQEQLKQQVQVNKELKTMLVASMGEDLEVQVQSLNDDKKHLANALLNSAQHLTTHQEQTEWLAGQCEVWRSKFLASSLLIEELAECKKLLSEKTINLQQAVKQLLDERCRVQDMMKCTYKGLYSLHEKWLENITEPEYTSRKLFNRPIADINLGAIMPHSTNILDLASVNLKLSENLSKDVPKQDISHLDDLSSISDGEKYAEQVMSMPVDIKRGNDVPVNALVHHAYNNVNVTLPVASCVHCNGRVQLL
ncbi:golgin-45 [Leptidea sinapis]|uniref:golgin-45 n=1 Tax=Leptidea sinapis TaxID=189913 RepID=UPI002121AFE5|nr:golgin-45 [Leptidea sinapis]